jgi:hypothetical protein
MPHGRTIPQAQQWPQYPYLRLVHIMISSRHFLHSSIVLSFAALASCGLASAAHADDVTLRFAAEVNGAAFACGQQYAAVGTTASTVTPGDYRFFVSSVALIDTSGKAVPVELTQDGMWQHANVALLDFENGSGPCINGNGALNDSIKGSVPAGDYTGLQLTLGIPFELNHADVVLAPSPLNLSAMFWNWQGGHRFLKVDMSTSGRPITEEDLKRAAAPMSMRMAMPNAMPGGMPRAGAPAEGGDEEAAGFVVHLGSTGCAAASRTTAPEATCANPNLVTVQFDDFDIATGVVVADIGKVLANANVDVNTPDTAPGCMSGMRDPECGEVLRAFGFKVGDAAPQTQQFFHAR